MTVSAAKRERAQTKAQRAHPKLRGATATLAAAVKLLTPYRMDALNEAMDKTPTHLDLFSGIGGFALAAQWAGFRTIGFCEIDKYCQKVLAKNFLGNATRDEQRQLRRAWIGTEPASEIQQTRNTSSKIFSDIFDLDGREFAGVDLITGGFPCQPFSVAGKRRGAADDRAIWPEMFRVISEARPAWVLGENVPGIIPMELDNVLSDLEGIGYSCRSFVIPACAVDARHRRDRLWIVANAQHTTTARQRRNGREVLRKPESIRPNGIRPSLSDTCEQGLAGSALPDERDGQLYAGLESKQHAAATRLGTSDCCWWEPEPDVGGAFDGLSRWLDGLGGLDGATKIEFASEAVCPLWDRILAQEIREPACISPEKVLLAFVCKLKKWDVDEAWIQLAGEKASKASLRGLRYDASASCPSCRSRHSKQHAREHPDFVQVVSRLLARHAEKAWVKYRRSDASPSLGWETGFARVSHGVQKRVDRLKGLGNAIVPQVAYEILKEIRKLI